MKVTEKQKALMEHIVNVFETGKIEGDYSRIAIYDDGPGRKKQITYGKSQVTEYGKLKELLDLYILNKGSYSGLLLSYMDRVGKVSLVNDNAFKVILINAGRSDKIMKIIQDEFFEFNYFCPARQWACERNFDLPLSLLVIYDSFIHSGSILPFLRKSFTELTPFAGGDEKEWVSQYVYAREKWLRNNENPLLKRTVYRTECFRREIKRDNWFLTQLPIDANGHMVK